MRTVGELDGGNPHRRRHVEERDRAYIKSDAAGWWCDPYWGCYLVGDPQYSNQFGFTGGVTIRF
ncbi:MAG: hypothetical protein ABW292_09540 [Vicinamibacterales bacterium]